MIFVHAFELEVLVVRSERDLRVVLIMRSDFRLTDITHAVPEFLAQELLAIARFDLERGREHVSQCGTNTIGADQLLIFFIVEVGTSSQI